MTHSLYRATIKKAWHITKNHTYLWILGFFAAFLGSGGEYEFVVKQFNRFSSGEWSFDVGFITSLGVGGGNFVTFIFNLFARSKDNYILLGAITFIVLMLIWIVVSSQGALIKAVADTDKPVRPSFINQITKGFQSFWSIFGIIIFARFWALFILIIIGLPIMALLVYFVEPIKAFFLVVFIIGIPILVIASLITKYAIAFLMIEKKKYRESLILGLKLFADNWLVSLEMAFVLFIVNVVAGAAIVLLILFVAVPFIILGGILTQMAYVLATQIVLGAGIAVLFIFLIFFGSALVTFQYASWTQLFLVISKNRYLSKIMRVIVGWKEKYQ